MKRASTLALTMLLCFCLSACGGREAKVDKAAQLRATMLEAEGFSFLADLRCDYGDRVWDCSLSFSGGPETASLKILEPELIAGLELQLENGGATLRYEGAALDTGDLFGDGTSAAEALPLILQAWQSGYLADSYGEKVDGQDCTVLALEAGTDRQVLLWFTEEDIPLKAEVQVNGKTCVFCSFREFSYTN